MNTNHPDLGPNGQDEIDTSPSQGQQSTDWDRSPVPSPLIVQGKSKKFPECWTFGKGGLDWVSETPVANKLTRAEVESAVGDKDPEARLVEKAEALANTDELAARRQIIATTIQFVTALIASVQRDAKRLKKTKDKTKRLRRYQTVRPELEKGGKCSLSMVGAAFVLALYFSFTGIGVAAEITIGWLNIRQVDLEGATGIFVWLMAYFPFYGMFFGLKLLDPGDFDRDRHAFYSRLNKAAMISIPLAAWLFASKVGAMIDADYSQANPDTGPAFNWVVWWTQIAYAIAVYVGCLKISDAFYEFVGYDTDQTPEWKDACDAESTTANALESLVEIHAHLSGAMGVIDNRAPQVLDKLRDLYARVLATRAEEERKRKRRQDIIDAKAKAAELEARAKAAEQEEASEDNPEDTGDDETQGGLAA